jgi:short-subunit dehydrogenase
VELRGQRIWLIGASSGIGAALAYDLAREGARLALSARSADALEQIAERARSVGAEAEVLPLDVTEDASVAAAATALATRWGDVDLLIYSAGAWETLDVANYDAASAVRQLDVNLLGLVRVVGAVLPGMVERRGGTIAAIASVAGYGGWPLASAYSASKAGMLAYLQSLRMDLRRHGVRVVTVTPGFVESPLTDKNEFPMPFKLSADQAAASIIEGLRDDKVEIHFPRRLSIPLKLLSALPRPLYEALLGRITRR